MNVVVTTEQRFQCTPDGAVWTDTIHGYNFWTRYLSGFDRVKVLARVRTVESRPTDGQAASGPGVVFVPVPDYIGPWQYLAKARLVQKVLSTAIGPGDAVIMRVSSHLAGCLEPILTAGGHPFGLEVINDPSDVFAAGAVDYKMRPLFRLWFTRQLRRQCRRAIGAAYVTQRELQMRYPCAGYTTGISDVEISGDSIAAEAREPARFHPRYSEPFHLLTVGSLAQRYKGTDVLIRAVAICIRDGFNVSLRIAGDGRHRPELERLAGELQLGDRVNFLGQLRPGDAIREQLDQSDLFVLPSRCEGLPRAMVEAMARSLPCIGSTVGGIPELLAAEDLVPPGDPVALAFKVREVLASPSRMAVISERNLAKAREFRDDVLAERRKSFFAEIRQRTAAWLQHSRSQVPIEPREPVECR